MRLLCLHNSRGTLAQPWMFPRRASSSLTHVNASATMPQMVDVGNKKVTERRAEARCLMQLPDKVWKALDTKEIHSPKGPVLATATVAGVLGAKRTADLIPFCHSLGLDDCQIQFTPKPEEGNLYISCTVRTHHKTGVEMEALTGASTAALCVYDMCKAISPAIVISNIRLTAKSGGKSDFVLEE